MNPTRAEIDLSRLEHNFNEIRRHVKKNSSKVMICGVVKANAYGHGIDRISMKLIEIGCDYLGVANYDEAIRLRKLIPEANILVFGTLIHSKLDPGKYVSLLHKNNLTATIASLDTARFLNEYSIRFKNKFKVHIKVDTGMRRIGFDFKQAVSNIEKIAGMKNLELEGIYTHFATAEERDKRFAILQLERFHDVLNGLRKKGIYFPVVHAANSGAILDLKDSYFNMIRPGILLYGYEPSKSVRNKLQLKPVMNFKSKVTYIKRVSKGESISYGRKYFTKKDVFIASIPAGYGDGYWRLLSNRSRVLIRKKFYRQIGVITMDWIMAELGEHYTVKIGDDVLLMGEENGYYLGADKLASLCGTIPYEILCSVADRVERVYIN